MITLKIKEQVTEDKIICRCRDTTKFWIVTIYREGIFKQKPNKLNTKPFLFGLLSLVVTSIYMDFDFSILVEWRPSNLIPYKAGAQISNNK